MITKFDDYPIHQTAEPIAFTASSDRFTYDRYWYNGFDKDGRFYLAIGLCRYPNLGIQDCGFTLAIDGKQYAFHGSRRAPEEPTDLTVGPFDLQILEPMGRNRLVIADNETGISCDLTYIPRTGVVEEGRQTLRNTRHVVMDATRVDQFGYWQGEIRYDGKTLLVDSRSTYAIKDRSWGIRPVGAAYTGGAPIDSFQPLHFMWLPVHWENRCTIAGWFEDDGAYQWHTDQAILPAYSNDADIPGVKDPDTKIWQGRVGFDINLQPGTRRATSGSFRMNDKNGDSLEVTVEPLLLGRLKGIGYMHSEWGHGQWQGELAIAGESWDNDAVDPLALDNIHIQQVVRVRCGDEVGCGVFEQLHIGPHSGLGFADWFDGAK